MKTKKHFLSLLTAAVTAVSSVSVAATANYTAVMQSKEAVSVEAEESNEINETAETQPIITTAVTTEPVSAPTVPNPATTTTAVTTTKTETVKGTYEMLEYVQYNSYIEISDCDISATEVVIPSEINGLPVKSIGQYAFKNCSLLENVEIQEGVTRIWFSAFENSGIKNISLPKSLIYIEGSAFKDCENLEEIILPSELERIEHYAFKNCTSLKEITLSEKLASIGTDVFIGCNNFEKFTVPEANENYSAVNGVLFSKDGTELILYPNNHAESYTVPAKCIKISEKAFFDTNITELNVSENVTSIGAEAFSNCQKLKSINLPNGITEFPCEKATYGGGAITYGNGFFEGCTSLEAVKIPESVTSIDDKAFYNCTALKEIVIPDSVTEIGGSVFAGCTSLESVIFPEDLKGKFTYVAAIIMLPVIQEGCVITGGGFGEYFRFDSFFKNCESLKEIVVPAGITYIEEAAFEGCTSLEKVTVLNPDCVIDMIPDNGENTVIYGYSNSTAQAYAEANNITFTALDKEPVTTTAVTTSVPMTSMTSRTIITSISTKTPCGNGDGIVTTRTTAATTTAATANSTTATVSTIMIQPTMTYTTSTPQTTGTSVSTEVSPVIIVGDANGDNELSVSDAAFIARTLARREKIDIKKNPAADYNGDGKVNVSDAAAIARALAKAKNNL